MCAALTLAGLASAGARADSPSPHACSTRGRTQASTATVRVYLLAEDGYYGCVRRTGRTRRLGFDDVGSVIDHYAFHGTALAYAMSRCDHSDQGPNPCQTRIEDLDVAQVRPTRATEFLANDDRRIDIKIAAHRRVGAILHDTQTDTYVVLARDAVGLRTLADAADVAPDSLVVTSTSISWRQADRRLVTPFRG